MRRGDFAQLVKLYTTPSTEEHRRYSPPRCHGAVRSAVVGEPEADLISTSFVERRHMTLRTSPPQAAGIVNEFYDTAW